MAKIALTYSNLTSYTAVAQEPVDSFQYTQMRLPNRPSQPFSMPVPVDPPPSSRVPATSLDCSSKSGSSNRNVCLGLLFGQPCENRGCESTVNFKKLTGPGSISAKTVPGPPARFSNISPLIRATGELAQFLRKWTQGPSIF